MKRIASLLSPLLLVGGVVACGGGSTGTTGPTASRWVDDVCTRMLALDHEVAAVGADLGTQIGASADPAALLTSLDDFLTEVSRFVSLAGADIQRLGVPTLTADPPERVRRDLDVLFKRFDAEAAELQARVKRALLDSGSIDDEASALTEKAGQMTNLDAEMRLILTDYSQLETAFDNATSCHRWVDQLQSPSTTVPPTTLPPTTTTPPATTTPTTTTPPTTAPATTVPPTTAAPTTVPVTVDPYIAVREMYLAAADEYNPKFDAVWYAFHDANDYILYKDMPAYCEQSATLEREWYDRMGAIPWPPDAVDEAQIHAEENQVRLAILDQCAAAPGTRAGQDALLTAMNSEYEYYSATVDALRVAIGLPPLGE